MRREMKLHMLLLLTLTECDWRWPLHDHNDGRRLTSTRLRLQLDHSTSGKVAEEEEDNRKYESPRGGELHGDGVVRIMIHVLETRMGRQWATAQY
jgi:hypothetical protein